jgi:NDP-sugar pyrophosphorylase family protein
MLEAGEKVIGYPFDGYWQDLGRADDYERAVQEFSVLRTKILG